MHAAGGAALAGAQILGWWRWFELSRWGWGSSARCLPEKLVRELERRGLDAEPLVVDFLVGLLKLDPQAAAESYLELAVRYLEEGRNLIDRDPVQASEKLYKAAEEAVKALATYFDLRDILEGVERSGRWSAGKLEKAVFEDFRGGGGVV